jgi:hypothetical protein
MLSSIGRKGDTQRMNGSPQDGFAVHVSSNGCLSWWGSLRWPVLESLHGSHRVLRFVKLPLPAIWV